MHKIFAILIFLLLSLNGAHFWRSYTFTFTGIHCKQNSELISYINCTLVRLNRHQKAFTVNMKTASELSKLRIDFLLVTPRPSQTDLVLVNVTNLDGCEFLENKAGLGLLQLIRHEFNKFATFPAGCPIAEDTVINVRNFMFDLEKFPPYFVNGKVNSRTTVWQDLTPLYEMYINGSIEGKLGKNKKTKNH